MADQISDATSDAGNFIDQAMIIRLENSNVEPPVKLLAHCRSLNDNYRLGHYTTVAILIRAILDYIPAIFGFPDTAQTYSQLKDKRTLKNALKQIDESLRNLADDALHTPARKGEILMATKESIDLLRNNLAIVLNGTAEQLRTNDLREAVKERKDAKPKPLRSQLDIFADFIVNKDWRKEHFDGKEVWICEFDNLYQVHNRDDYEDFNEPWIRAYADKNHSRKHSVDLMYGGATLTRFTFVSADGARISVLLPEIEVAEADKYTEDGIDRGIFYWNKNDLGFKLMKRIGIFYIYGSVEEIAKRSHIEIRE